MTVCSHSFRLDLMELLLLVGIVISPLGNAVLAQSLVNTPHVVKGTVANSDGSTPVDNAIRFSASVSGRGGEIINEQGLALDANTRPAQPLASGYRGGVLFLNTGNFPIPWQAGDLLTISISNSFSGGHAVVQLGLTTAGIDNFSVVLPVVLRLISLDVDGSGISDASDGVMILRRLNGAQTVTTGIILPAGASNGSVVGAIDNASTAFDVDGDGDADANDGVMILRRLNGAGTVTTGIVLPLNAGGLGTGGAHTNNEITGVIDALK